MAKKLTITDLIAQKERLKNKKKRIQTLYVSSLDAEIVIQEPQTSVAAEAIEMTQDPMKSDRADIYLVYHSVVEPNLKDPELQKAFGCVEPTDIVSMLFRAGEITAISGFALQLSGYMTSVKAVDNELKN